MTEIKNLWMEMTVQTFYQDFYARVANSPTHAEFCERVFGKNLCQHGFADMAQIERLIEVIQIDTHQRVLDLGCGNGMISEYLSDCTGAHVTGLDFIPQAISQAQERTHEKADRLSFIVGNLNALELPMGTFDAVIAVDSLYFSDDYTRTIGELVRLLRPGGQIATFYSHGREPWVPKEQFDPNTLSPDCTPLAIALKAHHLQFQTWDFTADDYRLAQLRLHILAELHPRFEAEGIEFIYQNRMGDAQGISQAIEEGLHARYLYHIQV